MSSNRLKPILKEKTIDLYEDIEPQRGVNRAEHLFDQLIGNVTKKVDTYSGRVRKPLTTICVPFGTNERPIDSSVSDDSQSDTVFEPSAKTSRTRVDKKYKQQNRVKFNDNCDQRVTKKTQNKKITSKKSKDYPNCTKEALLKAFQSAGLPDYEEIARHELIVTKAKDYVKAGPPTPPMEDILKPFEDLVDWTEVDIESDETQNDITIHSAKHSDKRRTSSEWETDSQNISDCKQNNDLFDSDIDSVRNQTKVQTKSVLKNSSINKSRETKSKPKFRRESITTAGLGADRITSTPVVRKHNITLKNVSPIQSIESPEVDSESKKSKVTETDETFVAPLPPTRRKTRKVSTRSENCPLDIVEPSMTDLQKVSIEPNGHNRSKQISRTLIDYSEDETNTLVGKTAIYGQSSSDTTLNPYLFVSTTRGLRSTSQLNELSSLFEPMIRSTPLVTTKQNQLKNSKFEFIVERSHFDVSMSKMCRSHSESQMRGIPFKTTTIVPVLDTTDVVKAMTRKRTTRKSNAYHLYRKSISSVQNIYNKSSQPFRTVVRTDTSFHSNALYDQTIRTGLKSKEDLKEFLNNTLSQTMFSTSKLVFEGKQTVLTAKQKVLLLCDPNEVIDFKNVFEDNVLNSIEKIGEGSYGEVFAAKDKTNRDIVIKVIPLVNTGAGSDEDLFAQILPELVISKEFNRLKSGLSVNRAPNFIDMLSASTARGVLPSQMIKAWDVFSTKRGTENEDPRVYKSDQMYIVLQLGNGGTDLESVKLKSAVEAFSLFAQLALSLAAAEQEYEFEHRDMHWGNVLITTTNTNPLKYRINGHNYSLDPKGVFASLIDFSLSRMSNKGFVIYDDLAKYSDLFEGKGDYQFDIYRQMREHNDNDWQRFEPKSNIFWLHYMLDKVIKEKKYFSNRSKVHKNMIQFMKKIFTKIRVFSSATDLVESQEFKTYLSELESN